MKVTVILPILNEEENIEQTIPTVLSQIHPFCKSIELLAIDDGSTDKTPKILKKLQKNDKRIRIITHPTNMGYGAALRSGISEAKLDWIFFTDADMQFDASELKKFIPKTKEFDFIVGYRKNRADPIRRKVVSGVYNRVIRIIFGLQLRDVDCAFKLMRKVAVKKVNFHSNSFFVSVELMVRAYKKNFRIIEIGVEHYPRLRGNSTVSPRQILYAMRDLMRLYHSLI